MKNSKLVTIKEKPEAKQSYDERMLTDLYGPQDPETGIRRKPKTVITDHDIRQVSDENCCTIL